ncbi:hypothetical protein [Flavobacterium sp. 123]|jgi:hypothetical protein|uniref:hypothetical protein n=1 Tax=Flavobacterium sp. 123 TaxID=2135627 RepID=UPI000EB10BA5|nr:hypothetical protein [Flavobacterium sp. 123]RKT00614.1 hypothetical protein C8C88_2446 [Flavobacterium sp. 123]
MKTLKLIVVGIILLVTSSTQAQVSVNVQIGSPPAWGPSGYSSVDFYYLPDIQVYYDIRLAQFIYFDRGRWIRSRYLPRPYRNYDLYNGYKVVLNDYHGTRPYTYFNNHKMKYYKGYKGSPQRAIGKRQNNDNYNNRYNDNRNDDRGNDRGDNHGNGNNGKGNNGRGNGKH